MSRDQVVGNLISADGKAALIYCFLAYGTDPKDGGGERARRRRAADARATPSYWGGAPFMQSYIFGVTQEDLRAPHAVGLRGHRAHLALGVPRRRGHALALFTTAVGIVTALGLMATFGVKTNLVLGSMPVILFALGSAYPIHILTRYYAVVKEMGRDRAIVHVITYLGPTVIASGLTAAGGLLSFVAMDMEPIRTFGLFTGDRRDGRRWCSPSRSCPRSSGSPTSRRGSRLHNHTSKGMIRFCHGDGDAPRCAVGLVARRARARRRVLRRPHRQPHRQLLVLLGEEPAGAGRGLPPRALRRIAVLPAPRRPAT